MQIFLHRFRDEPKSLTEFIQKLKLPFKNTINPLYELSNT